jgi:hypothetical protein
MRRLLTIILNIVRFLCGWAVLYIALGGLVAFAFDRPWRPGLGCLPYDVEGVLESECKDAAGQLFWSVVVGWPRFVIVIPAYALAFTAATVKTGSSFVLADAVAFALWSIPLALAACFSVWHWWPRSRALAVIQIATLLGDIVYLGLRL